MPKWWAISWTTVMRTSSTSSSSLLHMSSSGLRKTKTRSGRCIRVLESRWVRATPS